jgi:hypothetical protein
MATITFDLEGEGEDWNDHEVAVDLLHVGHAHSVNNLKYEQEM